MDNLIEDITVAAEKGNALQVSDLMEQIDPCQWTNTIKQVLSTNMKHQWQDLSSKQERAALDVKVELDAEHGLKKLDLITIKDHRTGAYNEIRLSITKPIASFIIPKECSNLK